MEYEPKLVPEGINTSREHPLREFGVLVFGLAAVIVIITGLLAISTDFLVQYIPLHKENEWFANEALAGKVVPESASESELESEAEQYLLQLIDQLRDEDKPDYKFTIKLLHSEVPNAFIIPGGHIFVTSGLLEMVQSENGLAMVLAHEMGHQYLRHPLRSLGRGVVISLALMVIVGADSSGMAESFIGNTAVLTTLGFNREQEREADRLGLDLLLRHYGHSSGSSEFFEAIKQLPVADSELPGFLSTHPGIDERIDMLRTHREQTFADKTPLPGIVQQYLESLGTS